MKILHVVFSFYTGGTETMLVDILNEQSKKEHVELIIINNLYNPDLIRKIEKQVKIHYINRIEGSFNPLKSLMLNILLFKIKPDVIHLHYHSVIKLIQYKGKAKIYLTVHNVNASVKWFYEYDRIFSISNAVKSNILKRGGPDSVVIYNGINFEKIKPKTNYEKQKQFKIIQVSSLQHLIKGQHILLHALHCLIYQKNVNNVQLDFIGEGRSLNYLRELTQQLNLGKHVNFLGLRDRDYIYNNLSTYDLLIQPSIQEGFGLTIIEGIAAGLPVIVSNIDGPSEVIQDLPVGFTFEVNNVDSLVKAISLVMELYDKNKIQQFAKESYDKACEKFSVQKTAQNYVNSYMAIE